MRDITDLVVIPNDSALQVFTVPGLIDPYLKIVRDEIDNFQSDVSTKKGRDAIASFAFKIAKCKTAIDAVGKEQTDIAKDIPRKIDAIRKKARDTLDQWKDEVRQPLTEWEDAEEARKAKIQSLITELESTINDHGNRPSLVIADRLDEVRNQPITEDIYQEFLPVARDLHSKAISALKDHHAAAIKREAEAAELEKLRAEKAERDRKDAAERAVKEKAEREARIATEAAAAAERKAKAEIEAAALREKQAKEAAEAARIRAEEAEKAAKIKAEKEIQAKIDAEKEAERKREANKKHCAKINNEAASALVFAGCSEELAKAIVTAIAKGMIPNVSIKY
ncbi:MAG: hypothetical protein KGJ13_12515 [Patescibacteria group bacterium]|nr:hypothetical protein [Patescibacteria group bacterium]